MVGLTVVFALFVLVGIFSFIGGIVSLDKQDEEPPRNPIEDATFWSVLSGDTWRDMKRQQEQELMSSPTVMFGTAFGCAVMAALLGFMLWGLD